MSQPSSKPEALSPKRRAFMDCLKRLGIAEKAHPHYVRWAEHWTKARGHESQARTQAYFEALIGKGDKIADWQFRQAADAARILAMDVLRLEWAKSFNWSSVSDRARIKPYACARWPLPPNRPTSAGISASFASVTSDNNNLPESQAPTLPVPTSGISHWNVTSPRRHRSRHSTPWCFCSSRSLAMLHSI